MPSAFSKVLASQAFDLPLGSRTTHCSDAQIFDIYIYSFFSTEVTATVVESESESVVESLAFESSRVGKNVDSDFTRLYETLG